MPPPPFSRSGAARPGEPSTRDGAVLSAPRKPLASEDETRGRAVGGTHPPRAGRGGRWAAVEKMAVGEGARRDETAGRAGGEGAGVRRWRGRVGPRLGASLPPAAAVWGGTRCCNTKLPALAAAAAGGECGVGTGGRDGGGGTRSPPGCVCVCVCVGVDGCPGRRTLPPPFVRCRRERGGKMATPRLLHRISNSTPLALCVPPRLAGLPAAGQGWMGCSPRPGLPTSPGGLLLPPGCKQGLEVTGGAAADGPGVARVGSGRGPSGVAAFPKPAAVKKALERLAEVVQACRERNLRSSGVANSRQAAALEKSEVVFYKAWPSNVFNYAFRKHRLKWKKRGSPA